MHTNIGLAARTTDTLTVPEVTSVIFVIDDDVSMRESLERLISAEGLHVETFASAGFAKFVVSENR